MPIQRVSQKVIKRYRGSKEILASYRGGQKVWSAVPPYAASGAIPAQDGERANYWKTVGTHTMTRAVQSATLSLTVVWTNVAAQPHKVMITVNGIAVATNETKPPSGANRSQSVSTTTALAEGDVIGFRITSWDANAANRSITGGSWSVNG